MEITKIGEKLILRQNRQAKEKILILLNSPDWNIIMDLLWIIMDVAICIFITVKDKILNEFKIITC